MDLHQDGLQRSCDAGHLTASTLVLDPGAGKVLLTLHGRLNRWLQLGGHLEATDRDLPAAALREAVEESGLPGLRIRGPALRLDRHPVPCGGRLLDHLDVQFLAVAAYTDPLQISAESKELAWFDVDSLPTDADASVRALVAAGVQRVVNGPA